MLFELNSCFSCANIRIIFEKTIKRRDFFVKLLFIPLFNKLYAHFLRQIA